MSDRLTNLQEVSQEVEEAKTLLEELIQKVSDNLTIPGGINPMDILNGLTGVHFKHVALVHAVEKLKDDPEKPALAEDLAQAQKENAELKATLAKANETAQ